MVAILYAEPIGAQGGMGGYNEALVGALLASGHSVTVVSSDPTRLPADCTYRPAFRRAVDRRRRRISRLFAYVASMVKVVWLGFQNRVVVWHFSAVPPIDLVVIKALRLARRRVVIIVHDPRPLSRVIAPRLQHRVTAAASLIVVHGPAARDELARVMKDGAGDVFVGALGDYRGVLPLGREESMAALGIDIPVGVRVCSVIGNLRPAKGTDRVMASLPALRAVGFHLLVAGSPQGNSGLPERVRSAAERGGVQHVLRRLTELEERAAYSLSDVVLALYDEGYSSGVIATAHALGRPVVMTDVGDLARQAGPNDLILSRCWKQKELTLALAVAGTKTKVSPELSLDSWKCLAETIAGTAK